MSGGGPGCSPLDGSAVPSATLFERAVGRTIDASVAIVLELVVMVPLSLLLWLRGWGSDWGYGRPSFDGQDAIRTLLWLIPAVIALAWVFYETVSTWSGGQTLGKRAAGIATVRASDGSSPSFASSAARALLPVVTGAGAALAAWKLEMLQPLRAGAALWVAVYLSALTNRSRRGLHDMLAGTVVVQQPTNQGAAA
ncbi:MAG: RDD family protein [Acidimicrobiales bacterium]|nr:RDD family protein [Acidimicrobiales bacterium]MYG89759.1 RDD family protein [Acidimicrobiales bacterium]MYI27120.1 RDD family protein [Acidimicrobiales bacterium]